MENIKIQKHNERYFFICFILSFMIVLYQGIYQNNILCLITCVCLICSYLFYRIDKKKRNQQFDYFIKCCDNIIDQRDFQIIDGESKESLLSHKLFILSKRYHQTLETIHQEQLKLKDYIEDISHQLKTPITSIRINTELMLEEVKDNRLLSILNQTKRIQNFVNDLQTLALIDSHNIQFNFNQYDLEEMIDDIQDDLSYFHSTIFLNKNIKLLCDYKWFIEALENIIKNCLEASHNDIYIHASEYESTSHIVIHDNGTGINEKDIPFLFQRFYCGKDSKGTGLGLYIAKEMIEAHHGFIHAYNQNGACFEIVIPKLNIKKKI